MKRAVICATIFVLSVMGITIAAAKAPPASLCYQWGGSAPVAMMAIKNQGTIRTASGPVVHYSINGTHLFTGWPATLITGSATFAGNVLKFNHSTIVRTSGSPGSDPAIYLQMLTEGTFDTTTNTGAITLTYINIPTSGSPVTVNTRGNLTITGVVCKSYTIGPLSAPGEDEEGGAESMNNGLIIK